MQLDNTGRANLVIQSPGDSYIPSHILPSAMDVGQRWKSEPGLGEDCEVPVGERLMQRYQVWLMGAQNRPLWLWVIEIH